MTLKMGHLRHLSSLVWLSHCWQAAGSILMSLGVSMSKSKSSYGQASGWTITRLAQFLLLTIGPLSSPPNRDCLAGLPVAKSPDSSAPGLLLSCVSFIPEAPRLLEGSIMRAMCFLKLFHCVSSFSCVHLFRHMSQEVKLNSSLRRVAVPHLHLHVGQTGHHKLGGLLQARVLAV